MNTMEWVVLLGGAAAIVWVNWYFFLAQAPAGEGIEKEEGIQEVIVRVEGGYAPSTVRVKRGFPVRLVFDRQETNSCSEEVVIGAFGIRRFLPAFEHTAVEFTPDRAGTFDFTCGMSMLHGKIVVE